MVVLFEYNFFNYFNHNLQLMKNGNWINILWAGAGFAILGYGLGTFWQWIGGAILIAWLVFIGYSYWKK